jgi:hypothetical protein
VSLEFEIDTQARIVRTTASGRITLADTMAYIQAVRGSADFDPSFDGLFDLRGADDLDLNGDEVRRLAKAMEEQDVDPVAAGSRVAIVADQDGIYGLARMYQTHREISGWVRSVRVFREVDAASDWLARKHEAGEEGEESEESE